MRFRLAVLVAILQLAVLVFMAGEREWILRYGQPLVIRVAPLDPTDPMRGEYAHLETELSPVYRAQWGAGLVRLFDESDHRTVVFGGRLRDIRVYATVEAGPDGRFQATSLDTQPPAKGLFIRGRTNSVYAGSAEVRYGIEAMFVQQGKAGQLEQTRRTQYAGVPLDLEIAVGHDGLAVLRGYHWESLGITVTTEQTKDRPARLSGLTITLTNHGSSDLAIVDRPGAGSFRMVPNRPRWINPDTESSHFEWVGAGLAMEPVTAPDIIVLHPGGAHSTHMNLLDSRWFVVDRRAKDAKPGSLGNFNAWQANFRIEYDPALTPNDRTLPNGNLVAPAKLRSRPIIGGGID
ncbi:MAG TPA: GDYXXLXY domain-containing protein [Candidatus Didemnitutus sp.]|nr:GDYXXLXY domain-containing protein [Candidatus Didemnitutus sp.]